MDLAASKVVDAKNPWNQVMERTIWRLMFLAGIAMSATSGFALSELSSELPNRLLFEGTVPFAAVFEVCLWTGIVLTAIGGIELLYKAATFTKRVELALLVAVILTASVILCGLLGSILPPEQRQ